MAALLLAGCAQSQRSAEIREGFSKPNIFVRSSVAQQALPGEDAISIPVIDRKKLRAPAIYAVRNGRIVREICTEDMKAQPALANMVATVEPSEDALVDELRAERIRFAVPAIGELHSPYEKTKIQGFKATRAVAPDDSNAADYVLANVATKCRTATLPANTPYIVVTSEARADKAYILKRGLVDIDAGLGFGTIKAGGPETTSKAISGVTFGVAGKQVP